VADPADLPPLRSKSEHNKRRTPTKSQKPAQPPRELPPLPALPALPVEQDNRVLIETTLKPIVDLPASKNREQSEQLRNEYAQQQKDLQQAQIIKNFNWGMHAAAPVRAQQQQSRNRFEEEDDDLDDWDDDSIPDSTAKNNPVSKHVNAIRRDDSLVMGYDDDDEKPQKRVPLPPVESKSASKSGSKIPRRISENSTATVSAKLNVPSNNGKLAAIYRDVDELSDISSHEGKTSSKKVSAFAPSAINFNPSGPSKTELSAINSNLVSGGSTIETKKKRMIKDPVWKMAPIPVRPYIAIPSNL
jgi:hypothetical protein